MKIPRFILLCPTKTFLASSYQLGQGMLLQGLSLPGQVLLAPKRTGSLVRQALISD